MRGIWIAAAMLCFTAAAFAADAPGVQTPRKLSPEEQAEADGLRALMAATPMLPMERVELTIKPAMTLGLVSAVTADKQGHIYVLHRPADPKADPILVLDKDGNLLKSFGAGMFNTPHGIRFDPQGNLWTIDANTSLVTKFTADGKKLLQFGIGDIPDPKRAFCGATDIAFAKNGHLYISDGYCNGRFLEYTADGKRLHEWGKRGKGPGEFNLAHDIAISPDNIVYVADREGGRLQWFGMDGKYLGEKKFGGQVFSVVISPAGDIYVGAHVRGVDYDKDSPVFKFDPKTGNMTGRLEGMAHQLGLGADGALYPGTGVVQIGSGPTMSAILVFRPKK